MSLQLTHALVVGLFTYYGLVLLCCSLHILHPILVLVFFYYCPYVSLVCCVYDHYVQYILDRHFAFLILYWVGSPPTTTHPHTWHTKTVLQHITVAFYLPYYSNPNILFSFLIYPIRYSPLFIFATGSHWWTLYFHTPPYYRLHTCPFPSPSLTPPPSFLPLPPFLPLSHFTHLFIHSFLVYSFLYTFIHSDLHIWPFYLAWFLTTLPTFLYFYLPFLHFYFCLFLCLVCLPFLPPFVPNFSFHSFSFSIVLVYFCLFGGLYYFDLFGSCCVILILLLLSLVMVVGLLVRCWFTILLITVVGSACAGCPFIAPH